MIDWAISSTLSEATLRQPQSRKIFKAKRAPIARAMYIFALSGVISESGMIETDGVTAAAVWASIRYER